MEDDLHMYEIIGDQLKKQESISKKPTYTVPTVLEQKRPNEYQQPSIRNSPKQSQVMSKLDVSGSYITQTKTKKCLVIISFIMALILILTLAAISLGAFGVQEILSKPTSSSLAAKSEEQANYTFLLQEISMLNDQLSQLAADVKWNISQIMNQVMTGQLTSGNATQLTNQLMILQNGLRSVNDTLQRTKNDIIFSNNRITMTENGITSINNQLSSAQADIRSVSTAQITINGQISSLQTISTRLDTSVNSINTWRSNPYRNCHQQIRSCIINELINENTRLLCTTATLPVNRTVSVDIIIYIRLHLSVCLSVHNGGSGETI